MPELATEHPEIERLYGLAQVNEVEARVNAGTLEASEGKDAIEGIGLAYQLVTDETAMLVLDDASFERHGIERENKKRVATERAAQQGRSSQPVRSPRVDTQRPMFDKPTPRTGGGAFDPITGGLAIALAAAATARARHQSSRGRGGDAS
jgi:Ca-activated chloride channel family protein